MLQEAGHIKNAVVLIFRHIQCLHLMNSEVAWVLVSTGTQVQRQIILDPDYLPNYLSVSYDYGKIENQVLLGKICLCVNSCDNFLIRIFSNHFLKYSGDVL